MGLDLVVTKRFTVTTIIPYVGPGDIVSGATGWWGLRGYNKAYADPGNNPAIDVVDTATGLTQTTINILANGKLDVDTISALGYAVSIKKWYDQTGNGNHMPQATLADMFTITLNFIGSLPCAVSTSASGYTMAPSSNFTPPYTISAVAEQDTATTNQYVFTDAGGNLFAPGFSSTPNLVEFTTNGGGTNFTATGATTGALNAYQMVFNGASSISYINGAQTSGNSGTTQSTGFVLSQWIFSVGLVGRFFEGGIWNGTLFTGTNASDMNLNQHTYWGF